MTIHRYWGILFLISLAVFGPTSFLLGEPFAEQRQIPQPVRAPKAMVASSSDLASDVGAEVLRQGGNAIDAAVAVGLALAVTYPSAGNIGGGGFMLIRKADGTATSIDFREVAPAAAHPRLYLNEDGRPLPNASRVGYLAAGVPGTVAGFALALEEHGTKSWRELVEPARKLAAEGFTVSPRLARGMRSGLLARFPESRRVYQRDGNYYDAGETLVQADLGETFRRLQEEGPREFYEGRTAQLIVEDMAANDGLITREDLRNYRPVVREPVRATYRGHELLMMGPPNSGGVAIGQMLNILENFDLGASGHNSANTLHLLVESMRLAFADRAMYLGDPAASEIPVARLLAKEYAAGLARGIDANRARPSTEIRPGVFGVPPEPAETTHYSVVDEHGNAVSVTYTINGGYGNGVTVKGAGFLLNNEMDDFHLRPGVANAAGWVDGNANLVRPGMRPRSSMTPTIVTREGELSFVLGTPGGHTIFNTLLQVISNVIDHGMNIQQAVDAPRIHHAWLPDSIRHEAGALSAEVREALAARGQNPAQGTTRLGDVQAIMIDPATGDRLGASDRRAADGKAVGH